MKIQCVPTIRYLGFCLDSSLPYKPQVNAIIKKVMRKKIVLSKIMPLLNADVTLQIYKPLILPYVDYCDVVYQAACPNDLDKLQRLQNKCLKTCLGMHRLRETNQVHAMAKGSSL